MSNLVPWHHPFVTIKYKIGWNVSKKTNKIHTLIDKAYKCFSITWFGSGSNAGSHYFYCHWLIVWFKDWINEFNKITLVEVSLFRTMFNNWGGR